MKILGISLFGCKTSNVVDKGSAVSGPFEITWDVTESRSGAWFNNGGDFNAKQQTSYFNINHKGNPVKVSSGEEASDDFWQVFFLKDAPRPALIAGKHSMYLITEENGAAKVTPLHEQDGDFATYQWLDSEDSTTTNAQPGEMRRVYLGDDSASSRFLSGGRYLMVNSKVVLDVETLEIYPFDLITYEILQSLENYHAGNSFVAQFSPGKTQMVFVGNRDNPANRMLYQYGLVVIDFKKNTAYAVPFDRTEKRFFSIWDATPKWLDTYFEWKINDAGEERIQPRVIDPLPYWQGRWSYSEETGEATDYKVQPIETTMLEPMLDFIRHEITVDKESREEIESHSGTYENPVISTLVTVTMETGNDKLYVYLNPVEQSISLGSTNIALIQQLGKRFDEEMLKGKYQEFFGKYE
ncbi:MAG TPA: hypothetical protein VMZ69_01880 [Saprospiraceae bacterium]|nr:hypothetical protein [Saprospiraceae bacterium]